MNTGARIVVTDTKDSRGIIRGGGPLKRAFVPQTTLLRVVLQRKWSILIAACVITAAAAAVVEQIPVRYAATASIVVDPRQPRVFSADSLLSTQVADPLLLRTRMEELRSPQLAREVVQQLKLNLNPEYCVKRPSPMTAIWRKLANFGVVSKTPALDAKPSAVCEVTVADAAEILLRNVTGSSDGRSFVIWVAAEADSPQLAADIANRYSSAFVALRHEEMQEISQQARVWLTNNASELRERMQSAAKAVDTYRGQHSLATIRGETLAAMSLSDLNAQLNDASNDLTKKQAALNHVDGILRANGNIYASSMALGMPGAQILLDQYTQVMLKQAQLRARLGDAHPEVLAASSQVDRSRAQIRGEIEKATVALRGDVATAVARRDFLTAQVQALQQQVTEQGHADVRLAELEREATLTRELYGTLLTRLTQIQAEESLQVADVRLAVEAQPPEKPFAPKAKMILVGVFLSAFGVGVFVAFVRDLLTRIFTDSDQVEAQTGLPVLGLFPKPVRGILPQSMVVDSPLSLEAEAVHSVLTSLSESAFLQPAPLGKVIMVTSSIPGEGKTCFTVALGRSASRHGLRAIVVDCDVRHPSLLRTAGVKDEVGASASPADGTSLFRGPTPDGRSNLHLLHVSGPVRNPHEALASLRLPDVIARLRGEYDLIILDTPPVLVAADAINLARLADEVVMVVTWRKATRGSVAAALKVMNRNGVEAIGVVLSQVDLRRYARGNSGDAHLVRSYGDYHSTARMTSS